jgi:hypothetical protein
MSALYRALLSTSNALSPTTWVPIGPAPILKD